MNAKQNHFLEINYTAEYMSAFLFLNNCGFVIQAGKRYEGIVARWFGLLKEAGQSEDHAYRLSRHTPGLCYESVRDFIRCASYHNRRETGRATGEVREEMQTS